MEDYLKKIQCPKCRTDILIKTPTRPLEIECPKCGKTGWLKK